ncbi:hypothetical protein M514_16418, partial [Trichuris suis]
MEFTVLANCQDDDAHKCVATNPKTINDRQALDSDQLKLLLVQRPLELTNAGAISMHRSRRCRDNYAQTRVADGK